MDFIILIILSSGYNLYMYIMGSIIKNYNSLNVQLFLFKKTLLKIISFCNIPVE